jgi:hypothetical protein
VELASLFQLTKNDQRIEFVSDQLRRWAEGLTFSALRISSSRLAPAALARQGALTVLVESRVSGVRAIPRS